MQLYTSCTRLRCTGLAAPLAAHKSARRRHAFSPPQQRPGGFHGLDGGHAAGALSGGGGGEYLGAKGTQGCKGISGTTYHSYPCTLKCP